MEVGIRVVRGPDWQWRNQDDGEGFDKIFLFQFFFFNYRYK